MAAMTGLVKDELSQLPAGRTCCRRAEISALLRFAGGLYLVDGRVVVQAELDSGLVARRLCREIGELYGHPARVRVLPAGGLHTGPRYLVWVERGGGSLARCAGLVDQAGRPVRGLPPGVVSGGGCDAAAAWRGAFLARGLLSEPRGLCSLEVAAPGPEAALALIGAARRLGVAAKSRQVRGAERVAVRDSDAIGELLGQLGASAGALAWQQRQLRRQAPATTIASFETANQRRIAHAAATGVARVQAAMGLLQDEAPGASAGRGTAAAGASAGVAGRTWRVCRPADDQGRRCRPAAPVVGRRRPARARDGAADDISDGQPRTTRRRCEHYRTHLRGC